uniref:Uncharacterized protein n=1 Tax=Octopus bimaculoides TaxID=37653 RepID=A0A0L8FIW9_OCTBM
MKSHCVIYVQTIRQILYHISTEGDEKRENQLKWKKYGGPCTLFYLYSVCTKS